MRDGFGLPLFSMEYLASPRWLQPRRRCGPCEQRQRQRVGGRIAAKSLCKITLIQLGECRFGEKEKLLRVGQQPVGTQRDGKMGQYLSGKMSNDGHRRRVSTPNASPNLFRLFLSGERQHLLKFGSEIAESVRKSVFIHQFGTWAERIRWQVKIRSDSSRDGGEPTHLADFDPVQPEIVGGR